MSLIAYMFINKNPIGVAVMRRVEGGIGRDGNRYECKIEGLPHPLTGQTVEADRVEIVHDYNDPAWALLHKLLGKVLYMDDEDDELERLQETATKYRRLRGHVRNDGVLKHAFDTLEQAQACAERFTEQQGKDYTAYQCALCPAFHVGHERNHDG